MPTSGTSRSCSLLTPLIHVHRCRLLMFLAAFFLLPQNASAQDLPQRDSLMYWVEALSGERLIELGGQTTRLLSRQARDSGNTQAMRYLEAQLRRWGYDVQRDSFSQTGVNLVAGRRLDRQAYYIFCAHFDGKDAGVGPAADDNASGTAAVLEAARLLRDTLLPQPLRFILWDEEELGLLGSKAYAPAALAAGDTVQGVINMDMLAWDGDGIPRVEIHTQSDPLNAALADILVDHVREAGHQAERISPGIDASDHGPFWAVGFPALLFIEDFNGDFNPFYHTPNDAASEFDTAYFTTNAQAAYLSLLDAAGRSEVVVGDPQQSPPHPRTYRLHVHQRQLRLHPPAAAPLSLHLYDLSGRRLWTGSIQDHIQWTPLPAGVYIYHLHASQASWRGKLLLR